MQGVSLSLSFSLPDTHTHTHDSIALKSKLERLHLHYRSLKKLRNWFNSYRDLFSPIKPFVFFFAVTFSPHLSSSLLFAPPAFSLFLSLSSLSRGKLLSRCVHERTACFRCCRWSPVSCCSFRGRCLVIASISRMVSPLFHCNSKEHSNVELSVLKTKRSVIRRFETF